MKEKGKSINKLQCNCNYNLRSLTPPKMLMLQIVISSIRKQKYIHEDD